MDNQKIKNILEAALLAAGRPVDVNELLRLFDEADRPGRKDVRAALDQLTEEYAERALEVRQVASGYRVQIREDYGEWVGRMSDRRPPRYSRALMETLALIAYRQPVTRGEIENVRGVTVSANIVRTLLERGWIRIVGHRDVPGRPAMLGTTKEFLDYFNLKSLDELPSLAELKDIDSINVELDFDAPAGIDAPTNETPGDAPSDDATGEEVSVGDGEDATTMAGDAAEGGDEERVDEPHPAATDGAQEQEREDEDEDEDEELVSATPAAG